MDGLSFMVSWGKDMGHIYDVVLLVASVGKLPDLGLRSGAEVKCSLGELVRYGIE